jgi:hypothetical protein
MVSHERSAPDKPHSAVSCGTTAEPENQTVLASSTATASSPTCRHLCPGETIAGLSGLSGDFRAAGETTS